MSDDQPRYTLASIIVPPSQEHCFAGLCGQKACCDIEIRVDGANRVDPDEEEVYRLPLCQPHALNAITAPLELAKQMFPPDESEDPPWEQDP